MNFDVTTFYILIFICIALILLLIAVAGFYLKLVRRFVNQEGELSKLKTNLANLQSESLSKTLDESEKILLNAQTSAKDIISKAQLITGDMQTGINQKLQEATLKQMAVYEQVLIQAKDQSIKGIQNISNDIKNDLLSQIEKFREVIDKQISAVQSEITLALKDVLNKANEEVENYKKQKITEIDKNAANIVKDTVLRVLGKKLSLKENEDLVIQSLEEAKKENFFKV